MLQFIRACAVILTFALAGSVVQAQSMNNMKMSDTAPVTLTGTAAGGALFTIPNGANYQTGGTVHFGAIAHITNWPAGTPRQLVYHYVINGTPGKKLTTKVPDSGNVTLSQDIKQVRPDQPISIQLVADSPIMKKSKTYSATVSCTTPVSCVFQNVKSE